MRELCTIFHWFGSTRAEELRSIDAECKRDRIFSTRPSYFTPIRYLPNISNYYPLKKRCVSFISRWPSFPTNTKIHLNIGYSRAKELPPRASIYIPRVRLKTAILETIRSTKKTRRKRNDTIVRWEFLRSRDFFPTFFDSNAYGNMPLYRFCLLNLFLSSTTSNRFSRNDRSEERDFERNVLSETFWPAARNFFPTSDHAFTFVRYIDIWPRLVPIFRGDVRLSSV